MEPSSANSCQDIEWTEDVEKKNEEERKKAKASWAGAFVLRSRTR